MEDEDNFVRAGDQRPLFEEVGEVSKKIDCVGEENEPEEGEDDFEEFLMSGEGEPTEDDRDEGEVDVVEHPVGVGLDYGHDSMLAYSFGILAF